MPVLSIIAAVALILQLLPLPSQASEQWPTEMPSSSTKAALRKKTYIGALKCSPTKFEWHGKSYTIVEAWIERVKHEKLAYVCLRLDKDPDETFGFTCLDTEFLDKQTPDFWAIRNWISRHFVYSLYLPDKGMGDLLDGVRMKIAPYGERVRVTAKSREESKDAGQIIIEYCSSKETNQSL